VKRPTRRGRAVAGRTAKAGRNPKVPKSPAREVRRSTTAARAAGSDWRIGIGYDSHRFAPGGPLILGGVAIPVDFSLIGHSDGDAVAHALTDAVLGAAGLGDIGEMFSDQDAANQGRNSIEMLRAAVDHVRKHGGRVVNADVTIVTETPRVAEYRAGMRLKLAAALGCTPEQVSVKGKSNERMGWIGRGEGLACVAVAMIHASDGFR
jgi:2-C-methyl-D-erythritol 2,4-cyclodiphosphate synthase